jgi:hypothetical protein
MLEIENMVLKSKNKLWLAESLPVDTTVIMIMIIIIIIVYSLSSECIEPVSLIQRATQRTSYITYPLLLLSV